VLSSFFPIRFPLKQSVWDHCVLTPSLQTSLYHPLITRGHHLSHVYSLTEGPLRQPQILSPLFLFPIFSLCSYPKRRYPYLNVTLYM
jgi:hypothetical protein